MYKIKKGVHCTMTTELRNKVSELALKAILEGEKLENLSIALEKTFREQEAKLKQEEAAKKESEERIREALKMLKEEGFELRGAMEPSIYDILNRLW